MELSPKVKNVVKVYRRPLNHVEILDKFIQHLKNLEWSNAYMTEQSQSFKRKGNQGFENFTETLQRTAIPGKI